MKSIKKVLIAFSMVLLIATTTACGSANEAPKTVPETIEMTMKNGAENYLEAFTGMDDSKLAEQLKQAEKSKNEVLATALTAWSTSKADLGEFVQIISEDVECTEEDAYTATVICQFAQRNCTFILSAEETYDQAMGGSSLVPTEINFTPEYTFGEKMTKAGLNTLMGMGTVFCVLIFISFLISCFKFINKFEQGMKKNTAASAPAAPKAASAPAAPVAAPAAQGDDLELVAVITAAVAQASGLTADQFDIKSINRR